MSQGIEKTINDLQKTFQEYWNNEQLDKLMTLYHPDAVLVGKGQWAVYGRNGIQEKFKSFFADGPLKLTVHPETTVATEDGNYAIQKGQVEFDSAPGKLAPYEQLFKKDSNGHFLIYHDEFEP
uniref:SnoaL-like domain-containing protein n=1 Tax=Panagrolaimus davidi TaxID=227884 RepID=A0A914PIK6_9BILA